MCLTPQAELELLEAADDACAWGTEHVHDNVIPLHRPNELEQHVKPLPSRPLSAFLRDRARDFLLMWPVHTALTFTRLKAWISRIDWSLVTLCVMLVAVIVLTCLSVVGLGSVLGYPSFVHIADFMGLPR